MRVMLHQLSLLAMAMNSSILTASAFAPTTHHNHNHIHESNSSTQLSASYSSKNRDKILKRSGSHFDLNRFSGKVEFGSTVLLVTSLENADMATVSTWLSDEKRVAMAIWDEKLIEARGDNIWRLRLMPLQFVTIQLAPQVDNRMWIEKDAKENPVFKMQSIGFDPNIQLLPGLNVPASSLGIDIEVVGELRASMNGDGVEGRIGFVSSGNLPPPMRLLPDSVLKTASNVICSTVSDFAIQSFQKGARANYREFCIQNQAAL
jgi:hypothetical protein